MVDDQAQLDHELARLAQALRAGELMLACLQLADFALKLDLYIRREERVLSLAYPAPEPAEARAVAIVHREHASLRRLVALIASSLDRADDRRGTEIIGKLRSVLLLHVAKEELLFGAR